MTMVMTYGGRHRCHSAKIEGATSTSYTPKATVPAVEDDPATDADESAAAVPGDEGMFLTATVSYRDNASPKVM